MEQEKKFFLPILRTYGENIEKRWRVEYWEPLYNGLSARRVVLYGDINKGSTIQDRYDRAERLISCLRFKPQKASLNLLQKVISIQSISWRPKTVSAYKTVEKAFTSYLGKIPPDKATEQHIHGFLIHLSKSPISAGRVEKYRKMLYTLYARAVEQKLCTVNPVTLNKTNRFEHKSLYFFSDIQIAQFKTAQMPAQLRLAIQFLFYTFIRPGELRGLKIQDINFEYGFIEIPSEISKNRKTQKVLIPSGFSKILHSLKVYPNSFYIFSKTGVPGKNQIGVNWFNNEHRKVLDTLKIRGRYAFYSWKHTGVVKAVQAGCNLKDLQLQLRHHSLDMVNEYLKNLGVLMSEDLRTKFPAW